MARKTRDERGRTGGRGGGRARKARQGTTDDHLQKTWKLKARGQVVAEAPRYVMLQDSINHLAHHRGQLTVYLRLNDVPVPAIYLSLIHISEPTRLLSIS